MTTTLAREDTTAADPELPAGPVEDLHSAFGRHHARAVHTKGTILRGRFRPSADAPTISSAAVFRGATVPVVARVSDFTGLPDIPDPPAEANPRGLALKLISDAGETVDIVSHSYDGFPVATAAEFSLLLRRSPRTGAATTRRSGTSWPPTPSRRPSSPPRSRPRAASADRSSAEVADATDPRHSDDVVGFEGAPARPARQSGTAEPEDVGRPRRWPEGEHSRTARVRRGRPESEETR